MHWRQADHIFACILCFIIVAFALSSSIGSSNVFSSTGSYANSTPSKRTLGTPVSGYWNNTHGTGALQDAIPPATLVGISPLGGIPNSFCWNGYFGGVNYMTPVKDQGGCGSCWAFASVGAMEAQCQINIGNPGTGIDLSEQNVLSCSGGSCSGWYLQGTLDFLKNSGTPDEACDLYTATDSSCGTSRCLDYLSRTYYITSWTWISTDTANIKNFLYTHGPVVVWMPVFNDFPWYDAVFWQYYFYGHAPSGQYAGHFVVIVGWDDQGAGTADDYWIVRNSWGTSGGDVNSGYGGYFYMTQDPTNGFFGIYQEAAVISGVSLPQRPIEADDLIIVRPPAYNWFIRKSDGWFWAKQWGTSGDTPSLGDIDGDRIKDMIAWRPSNGGWYILRSSSNYASWSVYSWGVSGDIPLVGDFDGDGKSDCVIWRPSNGGWYILRSSSNYASWSVYSWGVSGDTPLCAGR